MATVLILYAVACLVLLFVAGRLIISALRPLMNPTEASQPSGRSFFTSDPDSVASPRSSRVTPQDRQQLIEQLEKQFQNSPSYHPEAGE